MGLAGDDNWRLKVSSDGATWKHAMLADGVTGAVSFPAGVAAGDRTGFRNLLRNAGFTVNQRALAGTVTLAAGAYGRDGWKAGAAGAKYMVATAGAISQVTISAGTLIAPVENTMFDGGVYTLAHEGTAQARIWQGAGTAGAGAYASAARASGGLAASGLAAAAQTNVEFSVGTILRPQFEPGAIATAFERRPPGVELGLCQRYFRTGLVNFITPTSSGAWYSVAVSFTQKMRTVPSIIQTDLFGASGFPTTPGLFGASVRGFRSQRAANLTLLNGGYNESYTASAEI